ncbi:hypothetical protein K7X08_010197 [Anisodus acutangulus]|uniref:Uncharacterized protein n=1 Tax=Anisodus acutangulus TaxID=402998 RepID=A0A9Q1N2A2_9SOLA|nr:hypothetical protein K7X08_010197 [Anisodus acutangulus]
MTGENVMVLLKWAPSLEDVECKLFTSAAVSIAPLIFATGGYASVFCEASVSHKPSQYESVQCRLIKRAENQTKDESTLLMISCYQLKIANMLSSRRCGSLVIGTLLQI